MSNNNDARRKENMGSQESSSPRSIDYGEGSSRQFLESNGYHSYVPIDIEDAEFEESSLQRSAAGTFNQKSIITDPTRTVYFKIRFTSGNDVNMEIKEHSINILKFKEKIVGLLPENPPPSHIRLIYQGRILVDDLKISDVFSKFLSSKPFKSVKIQRYSTSSSRDASSSDNISGSVDSPIILHGQILEEPSAANVSDSQLQQIVPQTGFDRLQEAGFSEDDIRSLRTQFQNLHNIDPNATDPETLEQTRRLEEAWIDNATSTLPDGSSEGADYEYLWGMIIGFFAGVIAVCWIKEQAFSKKHQIGIFFGIAINLFFGLITALS